MAVMFSEAGQAVLRAEGEEEAGGSCLEAQRVI